MIGVHFRELDRVNKLRANSPKERSNGQIRRDGDTENWKKGFFKITHQTFSNEKEWKYFPGITNYKSYASTNLNLSHLFVELSDLYLWLLGPFVQLKKVFFFNLRLQNDPFYPILIPNTLYVKFSLSFWL